MRLLCIGVVLFAAACGHSHDADGYTTFQACFDEHTMEESLSFQEAVVVCCVDHPVNGVAEVCGATAATCVTYLGANLTSSATQVEIDAACAEYETQKGM